MVWHILESSIVYILIVYYFFQFKNCKLIFIQVLVINCFTKYTLSISFLVWVLIEVDKFRKNSFYLRIIRIKLGIYHLYHLVITVNDIISFIKPNQLLKSFKYIALVFSYCRQSILVFKS